jgi:hypothetical protein
MHARGRIWWDDGVGITSGPLCRMSHDTSSSSAPLVEIPVASGSSLPIHPYHCDAGFQPGATKGKEKYTYKDHRATNEHVNGLLVAGTNLWERVDPVSSDVSQVTNCVLSSHTPYSMLNHTQSSPNSAMRAAALSAMTGSFPTSGPHTTSTTRTFTSTGSP